jgi:L-ascorbate metabolism protein UlaG (beta-lactamase superfamily)
MTHRKAKREGGLIFLIELEVTVVHLGVFGYVLDDDVISRVGRTDVLMLPVSGTSAVGASEATRVMNAIKPSITVPTHYRSSKFSLPLGTFVGVCKWKKPC